MEHAKLTVLRFENSDVIATSGKGFGVKGTWLNAWINESVGGKSFKNSTEKRFYTLRGYGKYSSFDDSKYYGLQLGDTSSGATTIYLFDVVEGSVGDASSFSGTGNYLWGDSGDNETSIPTTWQAMSNSDFGDWLYENIAK